MLTLFRERYEVLATVGSGGEAQIVKALDRQHGRFVALKIRPVRNQAAREDLLGEARVLLALPPHPALPLVREDFFDRDDYVVAMDWVEGTDLATLLAENGRPGLASSSVMAYLAQAAEALSHLHSQSPPVIHGDVKPGNLILTTGGRIKLVDFGLSSAPNVPRLRAGTPGYRAPELATGGVPSRASDIYSLAATAFALLTGSAPAGVLPAWEGIQPAQAEQLEAAIRLGMATNPARRPKAPGELVERLRAGWSAALPTGVVTFCCSDIDGSTALWESNPEAMAEALVRHDELIADAVAARGGSVIKSMGEGDSTVSVFDSAPAALAAAFAANSALTAEEWPPGIRIVARWGIHTGEAERRDADYYGPSVNLAMLVRAQADAAEILLSSVTGELVAAHLPENCSLVDLGSHRLKGLGAPQRIHALTGPGVRTPPSAGECPYRGLLAFEPEDRAFFFGREEVTATVIRRLAPGGLLAVVGASGSGKSSVLRAGIVAAVRAGEVDGLQHASLLTPGPAPALDADDEPDRLVVVDQFEELFTLCDDADRRRAFIDGLLRLRCAVAIGVRADLYGRLSAHSELALAVADNHVLLGPMGSGELERAITAPARLAGLKPEPGLVELIVRDVAAAPGALPLLSHALRATWERRDGRTLTVAGYRETGGVASAIGRSADGLVGALPDEQRRLVRGVLVRMTELDEGSEDSRRRVAVGELVPEGAAARPVEALLQRLAEARLVTLDDGTAEVAHEALIREWPQLRRWLDEDRAGIRAQQQLGDAARLWDAGGRETSDLYRGARLAGALELRAQLNATERAFLDAAIEEAERERRAERRTNRRLRSLLAGAAALLVATLVGGVLALNARNTAQDAERAAEAQALTADAQRIGALSRAAPTLAQSMLYAAAAAEVEDSVETRGDLLATLQRNWAAVRSLPLSSAVLTGAAVSPELLASTDAAGVVRFVDLRTWKLSGAPVKLGRSIGWHGSVAFSPDGDTLAVVARRHGRAEVHLIDVESRTTRTIGSWGGLGSDINDSLSTALAYAPDGRRLAVALATMPPSVGPPVSQRLLLLDTRGGRLVWRRRYPLQSGQWGTSVLFLSDSEILTSSREGGETLVWDASAGRILRRHPIGGLSALSPDRRRIAIARNSPPGAKPSSSLTVLQVRTGKQRDLDSRLNDFWISDLAYTADGKRIVVSAGDTITVWDVASGEIVETYGTMAALGDAGVVLDHRGLALDSRPDGTMTVWDPEGTRRVGRRFSFASPDGGCRGKPCFAVAPRGEVMASSRGDGTVTLVDLRARRRIADLPARDGTLAEAMAFTLDGRRFATGGIAGTVTIRDVRSRAIVRRLRFPAPVHAVAFSPDGRLIAVQHKRETATETTVEVRALRSNTRVYARRVAGEGFGELAFTRDGRVLAASTVPYAVVAWNARSGEQQLRVPASDESTTFALAPDSELVAVGSAGGQVRLWDLRTGRPRGAATKVAGAIPVQLAISPDGRLLAVAATDGTAAVWDLRTRTRLGESFKLATGLVPAVAFKPDGRLIVGEFVSAIEWPLDRPTLQRFACRVAGRDITRAEWKDVLPNQPYRRVCG